MIMIVYQIYDKKISYHAFDKFNSIYFFLYIIYIMDSNSELVETELPKIALGCCERTFKNKLLINIISDCITKSIITTHINEIFINIETYEDLKIACRKKTDEIGNVMIMNDDIRKFMKELTSSVQACYNYNVDLPSTYEDLYRKILTAVYIIIERLRWYVINDDSDNAKYNVKIENEIHKCVKSMVKNYIAMLYIKISDDEYNKTLVEINIDLDNKVTIPRALITKYISSKKEIEEKNKKMMEITGGSSCIKDLKAKNAGSVSDDDIEPPNERENTQVGSEEKLNPKVIKDD